MKRLFASILTIVFVFSVSAAACPRFAPVMGRAVRINKAGKVVGVKAVITLENLSYGETVAVFHTTPSGWYFIPDIPVCGNVYSISARAKSVEFDQPEYLFVKLPDNVRQPEDPALFRFDFVATK